MSLTSVFAIKGSDNLVEFALRIFGMRVWVTAWARRFAISRAKFFQKSANCVHICTAATTCLQLRTLCLWLPVQWPCWDFLELQWSCQILSYRIDNALYTYQLLLVACMEPPRFHLCDYICQNLSTSSSLAKRVMSQAMKHRGWSSIRCKL